MKSRLLITIEDPHSHNDETYWYYWGQSLTDTSKFVKCSTRPVCGVDIMSATINKRPQTPQMTMKVEEHTNTYPFLYASIQEGAYERIYAHVQIISNNTVSSDWKLKTALC